MHLFFLKVIKTENLTIEIYSFKCFKQIVNVNCLN